MPFHKEMSNLSQKSFLPHLAASLLFCPVAVLSALIAPVLFFPKGSMDLSLGNIRLIAGILPLCEGLQIEQVSTTAGSFPSLSFPPLLWHHADSVRVLVGLAAGASCARSGPCGPTIASRSGAWFLGVASLDQASAAVTVEPELC